MIFFRHWASGLEGGVRLRGASWRAVFGLELRLGGRCLARAASWRAVLGLELRLGGRCLA